MNLLEEEPVVVVDLRFIVLHIVVLNVDARVVQVELHDLQVVVVSLTQDLAPFLALCAIAVKNRLRNSALLRMSQLGANLFNTLHS